MTNDSMRFQFGPMYAPAMYPPEHLREYRVKDKWVQIYSPLLALWVNFKLLDEWK